jgi:hypothetical protein
MAASGQQAGGRLSDTEPPVPFVEVAWLEGEGGSPGPTPGPPPPPWPPLLSPRDTDYQLPVAE